MEEESGNLQNEFFNAVRRSHSVVAVYLANGKRLVGRVKAFDRFTILLEGPYGEQIVFKHAISTVGLSTHETRSDEHDTGRAQGTIGAAGGVERARS